MDSERQRWFIIGALVLAGIAIVAVLFIGDDDEDDVDAGGSSSTSTTVAETTTSSEAETTTTEAETTSTEEETTSTTEEETTSTTEAETTTTTEADTSTSFDDGDTLTPITVEIDGEFLVFETDVECTIGPGTAGEITGAAEDETTIEILLDGEDSTVAIDGDSGTYDAEVTNLSNDEIILTIEAEPPEMEVSVALAFCTPLEDTDA